MATITARDGKWQVKIRKHGHPPQSKTFIRQADAEAWARKTESEMERGLWRDSTLAESTTLKDALEDYKRDITSRKKGKKREEARIIAWQKHPLAKRSLASIQPSDLSKYRDAERKRGMAENTIRIELMLISHLFEVARKDWGMTSLANPVRSITLPKGSKKRERRLEPGEQARLLPALETAMPGSPIRALALLALETGMREGELLAIEWGDIDFSRRIVHLDDTKSGDPRDVPLTSAAIAALNTLVRPIKGKKVFEIGQDRLIKGVRQACQAAGIVNFKFHDLRHEAASRFAEKLEAHELCKMFGWKTMQMALRYYHPRAEDLARKLA